AEDLLADDPHVAPYVGDDGGPVEEPVLEPGPIRAAAAAGHPHPLRRGLRGTSAAADPTPPLAHGPRHVALDLGPVVGRDKGTGLSGVVRATPQSDPVRAFRQFRDESIVDRRLHDRPASCRADLPRMDECGGQRVVDRGLEVGVSEDDVRALPAELQGDLLDVDRGAAHQGTALLYPARPPSSARRPPTPPVSETRSTSGESASAWPTRSPSPRTRFTTPRGVPASSRRRVRWIAVSGVRCSGFMTAVQPAARAGAIFQESWSNG